ncbi:MAG TPA: HupE/UreJ family protein, partial [Albitalea sp.]|nr:HupE/UreJ family protein [Albitalea sp.]
RVDVALRDLDVALDLDADGDGRLTWREVRAAWPSIEEYLRSHIEVAGCRWTRSERLLETRIDGTYAALVMDSDCRLAAPPTIRYTVLREVDPTHRGIARLELAGGPPVLQVLDPTQAAAVTAAPAVVAPPPTQFLREGVRHILGGYDHVLFLLCLLLPSVMRRDAAGWRPVRALGEALWPVLGIATAFTLAHSITLGLAASRLVSLPPSFIEPAIAVTIVLAALDNLRPIFRGRRVLVTFAFGLIHGFGFAGVLSELNLAPRAFAWALLQFNVGLELGQMVVIGIAVSLLFALRGARRYPAWVIRGGSMAAMLVGVLWFVERTADLRLLPL